MYTQADLQPFKARLADLKRIITAEVDLLSPEDADSSVRHPPQAVPLDVSSLGEDAASHDALTKLLLRKHDKCDARLKDLLKSLSVISVDLVPLHQKLITLRRQLVAIGAKGMKFNKTELEAVAVELRKIESSKVDGKFMVEDEAPPGQQILSGLLEETFDVRDGRRHLCRSFETTDTLLVLSSDSTRDPASRRGSRAAIAAHLRTPDRHARPARAAHTYASLDATRDGPVQLPGLATGDRQDAGGWQVRRCGRQQAAWPEGTFRS